MLIISKILFRRLWAAERDHGMLTDTQQRQYSSGRISASDVAAESRCFMHSACDTVSNFPGQADGPGACVQK